MKRFIAVLAGLLVLPAFAEVAPTYYDDAIEYSDEETPAADEVVAEDAVTVVVPVAQPSAANPRNANRNVSRAVPTTANKSGVSTRANSGRVVASRTTSNATTARTATQTTPRVTSRTSRNAAAQIASTRRAMQTVPANAARASIVQTDTVNTPLYTGRVSSRASAVRARIPTVTSISSDTSVNETAASTTSMDELAQITDFCKAQYTSCMDNFCNVLDDNQGRCSCSKNLKNYEKTEAALKSATEALQDVAQQIQYIGLSSDQIESLFTQTEAELQMQSSQDNTRLKNDLDRIRDLIVDVKSGSASSTATTDGLNFDLSGLLDFSIDSTGFDLSSLFGGTSSSNTSSISNQRGEQLYKTASSRCKASVLNNCAAQGVDISIITNSYDLEIDKQCIAYERSLTDANTEMNQTVRNAKSVLQRARLIVTKQKNNLTRLQCVQELDSCMRNEFVCGSEYEYCLDPTGKYIVNGAVVVGSKPGESGAAITGTVADGLYKMWNYESGGGNVNAWASSGSLPDFVKATIATDINEINSTSSNISEYLQGKIGYYNKSDNKNYGNCMSILNQCQDYTYTGPNNNREYVVDNSVISDYLNRTLIQIKSAQDTILADYAENCVRDVSNCLSTNNYDPDTNKGKEMSPKNKIATRACNAQIITCMSVNGITDEAVDTDVGRADWILSMMGDGTYGQDNNNSTNVNTGTGTSQGGGSNLPPGGLQLSLEALCKEPGDYINGKCVYPGKTIEGLKKETCEPLGTWLSAKCIFTDATNLYKFELPSTTACSTSGGTWTCSTDDCTCACDAEKSLADNGSCEWRNVVLNNWQELCTAKSGTLTVLPDSITCKICGLNYSEQSSCRSKGQWQAGMGTNDNCCIYDDREKLTGGTIE